MNEKNLYLLGQELSPNSQPTIQETIETLRFEIDRGNAVYSSDELEMLERKLADYEQMLFNLLNH
jgi:hypothetical protein